MEHPPPPSLQGKHAGAEMGDISGRQSTDNVTDERITLGGLNVRNGQHTDTSADKGGKDEGPLGGLFAWGPWGHRN